MPRISFRPFIVLFLVSAFVITAGVVFYWHQVNTILARGIAAHMEDATKDDAFDFNEFLSDEQHILTTIAVDIADTYPWADAQDLSRLLQRQTKINDFNLLGITGENVYALSDSGMLLPEDLRHKILTTTQEKGPSVFAPIALVGGLRVVVQTVPVVHEGKIVAALFGMKDVQRYAPFLQLLAMGEEGKSFIINRKGELLLSGTTLPFNNIFSFLRQVKLDENQSVEFVRGSFTEDKNVLVGYRLNKQHYFLSFVPLAINDWYIVSAVEGSYIEAQAHRLTTVSMALFLAIALIFFSLLFYIFRMRSYSNRQLFATAFVDQVTGADNFNSMCEHFEENLDGLNRKAALVIFDINKFKVINDLHGYEKGNEVLKRIAGVLKEHLTEKECFCRLSADKFILLMAFGERKEFVKRLRNLATQLRRNCTLPDSCAMLDLSFGIYEIIEDIPFYIMLDRAHLALDRAKARPFDKYDFYDEADRNRIVAEQYIEDSMEQALAAGEFEVFLQPKCDFTTGEIRGAEALVRWNRGENRLVPPNEFISVFERNGFILRLDMFILEQIAKLLARWQAENKKMVPLAVNFSRLHLNDARYIPQMRRMIAKHNVDPKWVEAELTENVIFNNLERVQEVVRELHLYGFSVAMDDFGSGYSSLNLLKDLRFDTIKLDKEFLNEFEENPRSKCIIEGAVKMLKTLGVRVVAEGVETREQADFLRETGCDLAQGFFFSRPVSIATFEQMLHPEK